MMSSLEPIVENWAIFLEGTINTLIVCFVTFFAGIVLALPLALIRVARVPILNEICWLWIYIFRSAPLLILLYLVYYGLPEVPFIRNGPLWSVLGNSWACAIIALTINGSAYMAEIFRVALTLIPKGEVEAAIVAGIPPLRRFRRIIAPRAFGLALPMIGNEAIFKIHSSAIISTITVMDILGAGQYVNARYYLPFEGFVASAAIYLILVIGVTWSASRIERRALAYLRRET